jgi:1,4-alpha-glucan branching enzyme
VEAKKAVPAGKNLNLKKRPPIQPIAERFPALEEQEVVLTFIAPGAKAVQIAGTFNGWRPEANALVQTGPEEWTARLVLKSGQYEYRFVVDGVWSDDPQAVQTAANPYGGLNSVLQVGLDDRTDLL